MSRLEDAHLSRGIELGALNPPPSLFQGLLLGTQASAAPRPRLAVALGIFRCFTSSFWNFDAKDGASFLADYLSASAMRWHATYCSFTDTVVVGRPPGRSGCTGVLLALGKYISGRRLCRLSQGLPELWPLRQEARLLLQPVLNLAAETCQQGGQLAADTMVDDIMQMSVC